MIKLITMIALIGFPAIILVADASTKKRHTSDKLVWWLFRLYSIACIYVFIKILLGV